MYVVQDEELTLISLKFAVWCSDSDVRYFYTTFLIYMSMA